MPSGMLQLSLPLIVAGLYVDLCALTAGAPAAHGSVPLVSGCQQKRLPCCCCFADLVLSGAQVQLGTLLMLPPLALRLPASATCTPDRQQWLSCCWPDWVSKRRYYVAGRGSPSCCSWPLLQ